MERLITILLLTITSLLEALVLLRTTLVPADLALALLMIVLCLVLTGLYRSRIFWVMAMLISCAHVVLMGLFYFTGLVDLFLGIGFVVNLLSLLFVGANITRSPRVGRRVYRHVIRSEVSGPCDDSRVKVAESSVQDTAVMAPAYVRIEPAAEAKAEQRPFSAKRTVRKRYSPGKYVASSQGKTYHAPKCDWAKMIVRKNRVWFKSEAQARRMGYARHSCLE